MSKRSKRRVSPSTLRVLRPYARRQWFPLVLAAAATGILVLADLAVPIVLAHVIDSFVSVGNGEWHVKSGVDIGQLALVSGGALIVLAAAEAFTTYESELRLELAGERIIHELRLAIYAHLQRLSISFHQKQRVGDLITRVTGDVDAIGDIFAKSLGEFISSSLVLLIILGYFIYASPVYALLAFSIAPILALLSIWFKSRARQASKRMRSKEGEIAARSGEVLGAIQEVQAFGSEEFEHGRMARISEERWQAGIDASKIEGRYAGLLDFTGSLSGALVLCFGAWQVNQGKLTPASSSWSSRTHDVSTGRYAISRARRAGCRSPSPAPTAWPRFSSRTTCFLTRSTAIAGRVRPARSSSTAWCSATSRSGRRSRRSRCSSRRGRSSR